MPDQKTDREKMLEEIEKLKSKPAEYTELDRLAIATILRHAAMPGTMDGLVYSELIRMAGAS
jgi:hypothetical protein